MLFSFQTRCATASTEPFSRSRSPFGGFNESKISRIFRSELRYTMRQMQRLSGELPDVFLATESAEEPHFLAVQALLERLKVRVVTSRDTFQAGFERCRLLEAI